MRVLIYGGRDFGAFDRLISGTPEWEAKYTEAISATSFLDRVASECMPRCPEGEFGNWLPNVTVVSGGARGADQIGEWWATVNWQKLEVLPADWEKYGKGAGHIRNQQMLNSGIDLAIEFPGGKGTADMRRRLDKAGVKVIEYKESYNGNSKEDN